ncbi:MAG: hypothetical protein FH758_09090 [Firmicutes bacterium]|nr:hypothetical protein [Bacillota bacterium]
MQKHENTRKFNLIAVAILTGLAFAIGGLFKTLLELHLNQIVLAIWFGFLLESAIGMAVLAFALRRHYPFLKLWIAGTSAFALGILFPAMIMNQFFYALLILPGFFIAYLFRLFLGDERGILLFMITLGFIICQMLMYAVQIQMPWFVWLREHFGPLSVTIFIHIIIDATIGIFVALGVGLMLRRRRQQTIADVKLFLE